jgi:ligand-binding sensor domain-containing protein
MKQIKYIFILLQGFVFFTSCYGQVQSNLPTQNSGQMKLIKTQSKNTGDNVHCGLQDRKGNLWFATTADGVFRYDGKSFTNFTTKDGLNSNGIFAIYEDKKGNIWFGTDKGLCRYDGKTFTPIPVSTVNTDYIDHFINKSATTIFVNSILEDKNGIFWFGAENGVYCYDGKIFTRFLDNPNLANPTQFDPKLVLCLIEDKKGNIWFTTRAEGIYRFDGKTLFNYKPNNESWFRGLLDDKDGNIWIGRREKGVCRYDGKTFTNVLQNGSFDSCTVNEITQDTKGNIWFATEGVWRYDGKIFENISKKDDLRNHATWFVLEDKSGNFWIGTRETGLYRYDGKTFTRFSE